MVTLKVRSAEDIIEAYLQALGWKKDFAKATEAVLENGIAQEHDILAGIDRMLLKKAAEVFKSRPQCTDKEQLAALFKYCFLVCNGAKKWGEIIFKDKPLPPEFIEEMLKVYPQAVPDARTCKMKPQKIESYTLGSAVKKFFGKRKKCCK